MGLQKLKRLLTEAAARVERLSSIGQEGAIRAMKKTSKTVDHVKDVMPKQASRLVKSRVDRLKRLLKK